eukprot:CAMPEP_0177596786 /NCGR_PEP_ID=MMETSP0419_2-20121207/11325_1 /TAXON_ID=582737 /ORGANISM="Tetraselmis sp., Strain GSL018" /LENGTH=540 /DNA_ID=CAMNT_0019088835 /DNA_START=174 /DNA_END=1792 /DNA_ORIENTATION=-
MVVATLLVSHTATAIADTGAAWSPGEFPNPTVAHESCGRGVKSWICDPDRLLSKEEQDLVEGIIKKIAEGAQPFKKLPCGSSAEAGAQVAVAVVKSMDRSFRAGKSAGTAARLFAKGLHDSWGVGSAECNNGVVLFLSVEDRQVYISTGAGVRKRLPDDVVGEIIDQMKPDLRAKRYGTAVAHAVEDIGNALANNFGGGGAYDWVPFAAALSAMGVFAFFSRRHARHRARDYEAVKVHLNKITEAQERAQRNAYRATSCPVCLEDFESTPDAIPVAEPGPDQSAGGDAPPEASAVRARPRSRAATPDVTPKAEPGASGPESESLLEPEAPRAQGGSGKAVARDPVALPCGHVFCERCIDEWMKGHRTCPICRKDPTRPSGDGGDGPSGDGGGGGGSDQPPGCGASASDDAGERHRGDARPGLWMGAAELGPELIFRLSSLQRRYPSFVTPHMVNRWAYDINHGRTIGWSADRDFLNRDPALVQQTQRLRRSATLPRASFSPPLSDPPPGARLDILPYDAAGSHPLSSPGFPVAFESEASS